MGVRRQGRELALKALYQIELSGDGSGEALRLLFSSFPADERARNFARILVDGVIAQKDLIDEHLTQALAHWSIKRLSRIDHNIMRMALFELMKLDDVPTRVTMDEAIELAKKYGDKDSGQFVNGVLDELAGRLQLKGKGEGSDASRQN